MKMRPVYMLLFFFMLPDLSLACSCENATFCGRLDSENSLYAIECVMIDKVIYNQYNHAGYFKVIQTFKDKVNLTDTIKLYGNASHQYSGCALNVTGKYNINDTLYLLAISEREPLENPDSLSEQYYENAVNRCAYSILRKKNGWVKGQISESIDNEDVIIEYPANKFEEALLNCSFESNVLRHIQCQQENWIVYPNPIKGNIIKLSSPILSYKFDKLRIISIVGQEVKRYDGGFFVNYREIDIHDIQNGIYILEIYCQNEKLTQKIIISR